jgi:hypothetical protein
MAKSIASFFRGGRSRLRPARLAILTILTGLAAAPAGAAGPGRGPEIDVLDWTQSHAAGQVEVLVTNFGLLGSTPSGTYPWTDAPSARWPRGGATEHLFAAGLWLGALRNGEPRVTTTVLPFEMRPGASELDRIYATHAGAPGGARVPWPDADDDGDGSTDEDWLDGRDNDLDGAVDEDFAAISDEMFFGEFADTDPAIVDTNPAHVPLGLRVQQSTLAWASDHYDDFIGIELRLVNGGLDPLDQVYAGFFADCDVGRRTQDGIGEDDLAGYWEGRSTAHFGSLEQPVTLSMGYMFDADADGGSSGSYVGVLFLDRSSRQAGPPPAPTWFNFQMVNAMAAFEHGGDPGNDAERYMLLAGTGPNPLPDPDPDTGLRPPLLAQRASDWRILMSAAPVATVEPGDSLQLTLALVLGPSFEGLVENAARAKALYDGVWVDRDGDPSTGVEGREFNVHWTLTGPVAVAISDLEARSEAGGLRLAWSLSGAAAHEVSGVHVERAPERAGPWGAVTAAPLAPARRMSFVDAGAAGSAWYRLALRAADGSTTFSAPVHTVYETAADRTALLVPVQIDGDRVDIPFRLAAGSSAVRLRIYDLAGRRVRGLDPGPLGPGAHLATWSRRDDHGRRVARGVYLVLLRADGASHSRKLLVTGE